MDWVVSCWCCDGEGCFQLGSRVMSRRLMLMSPTIVMSVGFVLDFVDCRLEVLDELVDLCDGLAWSMVDVDDCVEGMV